MRNKPITPLSRNRNLPPVRPARGPNRSTGKKKALVWIEANVEDVDIGFHHLLIGAARMDPTPNNPSIKPFYQPLSITKAPNDLHTALIDRGCHRDLQGPDGLAMINAALALPCATKIKRTSRPGWHGQTFVSPFGSYGPEAKTLRYHDDDPQPITAFRRGTLQDWNDGLRDVFAASPIALFTCSVGFGAPLMKLAGETESVTFMLQGESSGGKSLVTSLLLTLDGSSHQSRIQNFEGSDSKFEEFCWSHTDGAGVLGDAENITDPKKKAEYLSKIAYRAANGSSRGISKKPRRDGDLRNLSWRGMFVGTCEASLDNGPYKRNDGDAVRMIVLPVADRADGSIFARLDPRLTVSPRRQSELVDLLKETRKQHYGRALPAFLKWLQRHRQKATQIVIDARREVISWLSPGSDGLARRLAEKVGCVLGGAIAAARAKVVPWTEEQARQAVREVWDLILRHRAKKATVVNLEPFMDRIREAVRSPYMPFLEEKAPRLDPRVAELLCGFQRTTAEGIIAAFVPARFERLLANTPDRFDLVIAKLRDDGILIPSADRKNTKQVSAKGLDQGGKQRFYCLKISKLC